MIDLFYVKSYDWEDDDLPLSYSFGFYVNSNSGSEGNGKVILQHFKVAVTVALFHFQHLVIQYH